MSHIVSIDIGTSGIKVGVMSKTGKLIVVEKETYDLIYKQVGYVEINLEMIWNKVKELINNAISTVQYEGGKVDAISLSTFCNSSVFMDRDGNPLSNGIMYLDSRSADQADFIKKTIGEEYIYSKTKNRIEPGIYTCTSLLWFKENKPSDYEKMKYWGNLSTFILSRMTGNFVMDWTQASYTGIFDIKRYEWSDDLCQKLDIDMDTFPKIVSPFQNVGKYESISVIAGAADTACSSFALQLKPGEVFESVGTSNVLSICTEDPNNLDVRFQNRCYVWEKQWLSHGAMSTPGASINWFYDTFLSHLNDKTVLDKLPADSTIGSNGIFFLPYMYGERTPIWDPNARGVFLGLTLNSSKEDMLRAIMEGSGFGLKQVYEIIENEYQIKVDSFRSIGGGSKNETWAQIKSNILQKTIHIQKISETALYGSSLIGAYSVGYFNNTEEIGDFLVNKTMRSIEPDKSTFDQYDLLYGKFLKIYPTLKELF